MDPTGVKVQLPENKADSRKAGAEPIRVNQEPSRGSLLLLPWFPRVPEQDSQWERDSTVMADPGQKA